MAAEDGAPTLDYEQAREAALRILSARQRSCAELRDRLIAKGASYETAEDVVTRFQEVSLLDDAELARQIVRVEQGEKGHGQRRVRQRLQLRGIPAELAEEALLDAGDEGEYDRALAQAQRLHRKNATQPSGVQWRRIRDGLLRRGFAPPIVSETVQRVVSQTEDNA